MVNTPEEIEALFPQSIPEGACPDDSHRLFCMEEAGHPEPHTDKDLNGHITERWYSK